MLFDTGAQVSLISTALAAGLGLDLGKPDTTISVKGAAGEPIAIPGFTLGELVLGAAIDGPAAGPTREADAPQRRQDRGHAPGINTRAAIARCEQGIPEKSQAAGGGDPRRHPGRHQPAAEHGCGSGRPEQCGDAGTEHRGR